VLQSGAGQAHAWRKLVLPLDDRLRRWKEWGDYYPTTLATSTWQGKPYGIPARVDARAMLYRQDLFQREGLRLPATWDEFRDAALRLSKRQGSEVPLVGYDPVDWDNTSFGSQRLIPKLWQNGAEVVSPDGRKVLFNSPEGVEALRWWTDLLNTIAPLGATLPTAPTGASRLAGGGAAAIMAGQWIQVGAITAVPEAVPHIVVRPPLQQKRAQINVFANWFGLGAQSKAPDLTWDLLLHLNRAEHLLEYLRLVGSTLPRKGLPDTPYTTDPRYQIKAWGEILEKYSRPQPLIVTQTGTNAGAVMSQAMRAAREGAASPKQALDEAARLWQEYIDGGHRELGL
jgi:ABC-type glycerol-3-phosphate transport system substrate-binding protein